jgi:hypothetical protein
VHPEREHLRIAILSIAVDAGCSAADAVARSFTLSHAIQADSPVRTI